MMDEITFEITDYCPYECSYCSSKSIDDKDKAEYLKLEKIKDILEGKHYEHIIISGGEPLSHPDFYEILKTCKEHSDDVIVYSNEIEHLIYNPNVIDSVYVEANLTITKETERVNILKRVKQGKEKKRPEIKFSKNWTENCSCEDRVVRPDGKITRHPCDKFKEIK